MQREEAATSSVRVQRVISIFKESAIGFYLILLVGSICIIALMLTMLLI